MTDATPQTATPANTDPSQYFSKLVQGATQITKDGASSAVATGQNVLQNLAKPCASCTKTNPYSLAFLVTDKNGKLCGEGMYYTVKYKISGEIYPGSTNKLGFTERYYASNPAEIIILYLGKREKADGYPEDQSVDENKYDEAPLAQDTVAPVAEEKVGLAKTQRLWKPWTTSDVEKDFIKQNIERFAAHYYDLGDGGLTIGYGDFTPYKLADGSPNPAIAQLKKNYPPSGPGMSEPQATQDFESNLKKKAKANAWNSSSGADSVNVPLYQNEFDALISMRYNNPNTPYGTTGADPVTHALLTKQTSPVSWLNRGRYTRSGVRIKSTYNTVNQQYNKVVTNRRNSESKTFLTGSHETW